jgi:hypothetical protein
LVLFSAEPAAGTIRASGHAPATESSHTLPLDAGTVIVTGYAPSLIIGTGASVTTQHGTLVVAGQAPSFAAHIAVVANDSNLAFIGYSPGLQGEQVIHASRGSLGFTGYPPFVIHLPPASRRIIPIGGQDRQAAVSGRRRVIRVGMRRSGGAA